METKVSKKSHLQQFLSSGRFQIDQTNRQWFFKLKDFIDEYQEWRRYNRLDWGNRAEITREITLCGLEITKADDNHDISSRAFICPKNAQGKIRFAVIRGCKRAPISTESSKRVLRKDSSTEPSVDEPNQATKKRSPPLKTSKKRKVSKPKVVETQDFEESLEEEPNSLGFLSFSLF